MRKAFAKARPSSATFSFEQIIEGWSHDGTMNNTSTGFSFFLHFSYIQLLLLLLKPLGGTFQLLLMLPSLLLRFISMPMTFCLSFRSSTVSQKASRKRRRKPTKTEDPPPPPSFADDFGISFFNVLSTLEYF